MAEKSVLLPDYTNTVPDELGELFDVVAGIAHPDTPVRKSVKSYERDQFTTDGAMPNNNGMRYNPVTGVMPRFHNYGIMPKVRTAGTVKLSYYEDERHQLDSVSSTQVLEGSGSEGAIRFGFSETHTLVPDKTYYDQDGKLRDFPKDGWELGLDMFDGEGTYRYAVTSEGRLVVEDEYYDITEGSDVNLDRMVEATRKAGRLLLPEICHKLLI